MKKINVSALLGTLGAPYLKQTFIHNDEQVEELGDALVKSLLGSYTTDDLIILHGCVISGTTTKAITAGAIYYNGEVYLVDAATGLTAGADTWVFDIVTTYAAGDPVTYDDESTHNQHQIDKIAFQVGTTGSGIADWDSTTVKSLSEQRSDDIQTYQTGWSNAGSCQFKELPFGDIEFTLNVAISAGGTTSVGTAPSWAIPAFLKRYYMGDYNGSDGASELLIMDIAATTGAITIVKQADGTKPSNRGSFYQTVRYNKNA